MNKLFRDIKTEVMARPEKGTKHREPYDHDPLVTMNDYTKNISVAVFSPGDMPVRQRASSSLHKAPSSK